MCGPPFPSKTLNTPTPLSSSPLVASPVATGRPHRPLDRPLPCPSLSPPVASLVATGRPRRPLDPPIPRPSPSTRSGHSCLPPRRQICLPRGHRVPALSLGSTCPRRLKDLRAHLSSDADSHCHSDPRARVDRQFHVVLPTVGSARPFPLSDLSLHTTVKLRIGGTSLVAGRPWYPALVI